MENLESAIESGNEDLALQILEGNPELANAKTEDGWAVLQLSAYYDLPKLAQHLLEVLPFDQANTFSEHPLSIAFEECSARAVDVFMSEDFKEKVNWNHLDGGKNNFLMQAVRTGDVQSCKTLWERGVNPFQENHRNRSAMNEVCRQGNQTLFNIFAEHAELSKNFNESFIGDAIISDSAEIVERLLPYSSKSRDYWFSEACSYKSVRVVDSIVQSNEILLGEDQIGQLIELSTAVYKENEAQEAATQILEHLFDLNLPFSKFVNEYGQNAWMLAIENGNRDAFKALLERSEYANNFDANQRSALFYAVAENQVDFAKALLKRGVSPIHKDKNGNTPLIEAVRVGNEEMVDALLQYTGVVNTLNDDNEHALSIAVKLRKMGIVSKLIWAGGEIASNPHINVEEIKIPIVGVDGSSDTFSYHNEECYDNFATLTKLGFDLNQVNEYGDTFLLHFIKNNYASNFQALMRCSVSPNQTDMEGNNALMCAATKKQEAYFNLLIDRFSNIDLRQTNSKGENIYDLCLKSGQGNRAKRVLLRDDNPSQEDVQKAVRLITATSSLEEIKDVVKGFDWSHQDENGNSLFMFAAMRGNLENFQFLLKNTSLDTGHKNTAGYGVLDIINGLPEETRERFLEVLPGKLNKRHEP